MSRRKTSVMLIAVVLVLSLVPTAGLATHEADKPVETKYGYRVDTGNEVYDEPPSSHHPGGDDGSVILYMAPIEKTIRLQYLVFYSPLNTSACETTDIAAGGIDRGNDDQYTKTDKSLIGAYEGLGNKTSDDSDLGPSDDPGPIAPDGWNYRAKSWIDWWDPDDAFGGDPVVANPDDEGILALKDCVQGPTTPGWYRGWIKFNGTNPDDGQNYTFTAFSNWNYVCECDSYDQAIDTIGEPPAGYTVEEGETSGGGDAGEDTPTETATVTATATETQTETQTQPTATPTETPTETVAQTTTDTPEPTDTQADGGGTEATDGGGPGFGIIAAMLGLLGAVLLGRRVA